MAPESTLKYVATDVTRTVHRTSYPSIDPSRPELSQRGRTALITGGSASIGFYIAKAFIRAGASTIVITGRRQEQLDIAETSLEEYAQKTGTRIISEKSDVNDPVAVDQLWDRLSKQDIVVDVLVLNAARFAVDKPLLELGVEHVWKSFEANVRPLLQFSERFKRQRREDRPGAILNLSTCAIHMSRPPFDYMAERPEYGLSKATGTTAMQFIAQDANPDEIQVVSYHPGIAYSETWQTSGVPQDALPFDDIEMSGNYAVWAASKEARFLHGRFVWASWDVDELAKGEIRKRIDSEPEFLRFGVCGLARAHMA